MSKTWRDLLIVDSLINKGTYKTPVIVKVLADSGSVENPSITIGEEEIKYNGIIDENGLLKIDTDKMTVVSNVGEVLSFDGVDDYVDCGNDSSLDITDDLTIELIVNVDEDADNVGGVVKGISGGWASNSYGLRNYAGSYRFYITDGIIVEYATVTPIRGKFCHIAGVTSKSSGKITVYRDGEFVSEVDRTVDNIQVQSGPLQIGTAYSGAYLKGKISEVRIWNVARTQQQIQGNINRELTGNETGLVGYWKFNEGAGTIAYDSAGANHGTIHGATWVNVPRYYFTNTLANYEGGFPKLPPGNTDVSVTADIGTPMVTFKWHDRWV